MAQYTPIFEKPYENGYENLPSQTTPITAETLNDKDDAIVNIESYLSQNDIPTYEEHTNTSGEFKTLSGGILSSCVVNLELIQSGSGTPSPQNVRPITGHTAVETWVHGKNLMPPQIEYTDGTHNYFKTSNDVLVKSGTYTASFFNGSSNSSKLLVNKVVGGVDTTIANVTVNSNSRGSATVTLTEDTYLKIVGRFDPTSVISDLSVFSQIQLEEGTLTAYEPYNGKTYTIQIGQTVYSGELDVVSGVGSTDKDSVTINGSTVITAWSAPQSPWVGFQLPLSRAKIGRQLVQSNYLDSVDGNITSWNAYIVNNNLFVCVNENTIGSRNLTDISTYLGNNNLQIVYPLQVASDINTTPQQLETLIGQNTVTTPLDGQSLDSLSYREVFAWDDVERAVAVKLDLSSVAPIEYTDKASQSYNQKQLFIKDNKLCQALASISSGASFTENTNFKYTTLAEIIEPLIP